MSGVTTGGGPKKGKRFWLWPFQNTERTVVTGIIAILAAIVLNFVAHPDKLGETGREANSNKTTDEPAGNALIAAAQNAPVSEFIVDLLKELGIAFLIAAVISEGIERIAHDKQAAETRDAIDKIKENLLESVYKTKSASVFFDPFKKYVLQEPLIRTNCLLQIDVYPEKDGPLDGQSLMVLDVKTTFALENCSKEGKDFNIPAHIEQPWPEMKSENDITVKKKNANTDKYEAVQIKIDDAVGSDDLKHFYFSVHIEALSHCDIIVHYKLLKYGRDSSSFISIIPTDRMNIFINYKQLIDLFYTSIHSKDFIDESMYKGDGKLQLLAAEPLFPGNGIEFWWRPKELPLKETATHANMIVNGSS
jgi:hypothetical protein